MEKVERILVTGGGGFIGSHLARYLHDQGSFVRIADVKSDDYIRVGYYDEALMLDLRKPENCLAATKGIDKVYNLAANMGGIGYITAIGAEVMRDNTLINTNMLEASRQNSVRRFLFTSSACIYPTFKQNSPEIPGLREEDASPADPDNYYGWEKLFAERMCEAYRRDYGMDLRILRYHNIYGPEGTYKGGREKSPAAISRKVAEAADPGTLTIWGDGKQTRSYCYIDDAVDGTVKLMESSYMNPINIGSDQMVTINELSDIIIRISGKTITKIHDLKAPQGVRGRNADITKAKQALGWSPKVSLNVGLEKTYRWIKMRVNEDKETQMKPSPIMRSN